MIERIYLQIKGMRTMFLIPLLMYFLFIPFSVWLFSQSPNSDIETAATQICYILVPILSTWWLYILQREYIEGDGREVLLLGKGTLSSAILFWILNVICFFVMLFYVDVEIRHEFWTLAVELVILSFFMNGFVYFLNFHMKSITASMFVTISYTAFSNYSFYDSRLEVLFTWLQLQSLQDVPFEDTQIGYFKFILAGLIFWILGVAKSRKME